MSIDIDTIIRPAITAARTETNVLGTSDRDTTERRPKSARAESEENASEVRTMRSAQGRSTRTGEAAHRRATKKSA